MNANGEVSGTAVPGPVTAQDVVAAVGLLRRTCADVPDGAWEGPAGTLSWSCRETLEHTADDLFAYALELAPQAPEPSAEVPVVAWEQREGGPRSTVFAAEGTGTAGLLRVLDACGGLLAAVVRTAPPEQRGYHGFGVGDAEGFAAMGVVEVLVHGHDLAAGLGTPWQPDGGLCARVLHRLFPDAAGELAGHDPWQGLLWATGRTALPGLPARDRWRWYGAPAGER